MKNSSELFLRIHGDNIIECERGLQLIADALSAKINYINSPLYKPLYEIERNNQIWGKIELLAGHGRWGINIQEIFQLHGAPVREATDAIITKVLQDTQQEEILLAMEFSSALPAGNNAWQRNGRALACAAIGVPYLYFTEVGGVELGKNRTIKAPRFPNPIVPFSYLTATKAYGVVCLPVFTPSPSNSRKIYAQFSKTMGTKDVQLVVKHILESTLIQQSYQPLASKALAMVEILSGNRKRVDTLQGNQWAEFLRLETNIQKVNWLEQNPLEWSKKRASKVKTTVTFQKLNQLFQTNKSLSIGASTVPICLIPARERSNFAKNLITIYNTLSNSNFLNWINTQQALVIVWITGFKPKGDDSRPDRGLVPLTRMIFGDDMQILTIVSGPAKTEMWELLIQDSAQLAKQNGLWESIINLSNAILVDSPTLLNRPLTLLLNPISKQSKNTIHFPSASSITQFSEQDVDSVIHLIFSDNQQFGVFEAMCNPPGGDWSGFSLLEFATGNEFHWTSLPRVSKIGGKRPDHVIQFLLDDDITVLLAIESKDFASKLSNKLGTRLKTYIQQLVKSPPIAVKTPTENWNLWQEDTHPFNDIMIISGGAFCWKENCDLLYYLNRCQFDIIIGIEFDSIKQTTLLHIKVSTGASFLLSKIDYLAKRFDGRLKIQIH